LYSYIYKTLVKLPKKFIIYNQLLYSLLSTDNQL